MTDDTARKGKQLELWTAKLFDELGYRTLKTDDGCFAEIIYADTDREGHYVPPMFQVDIEYRERFLGPRVICECKNYQDTRNLNIDATLVELLAKTQLTGASRGQLIIPAEIPSREKKEERYRGVIEIYDLGILDELDQKRRRRIMPITHIFRKRLSIARQIQEMRYDPLEHHRRVYRRFPVKPAKETLERYRNHVCG